MQSLHQPTKPKANIDLPSPWVFIHYSSSLTNSLVNVPKTRRTYCKGKNCRKHTVHKVTQYKTGKASVFAQVEFLPAFTFLQDVTVGVYALVQVFWIVLIGNRENDDTIGNKVVMVAKPNPFSTRKQRLQRKLCWGWNAMNANIEHSYLWNDANTLNWVEKRRQRVLHLCFRAGLCIKWEAKIPLHFAQHTLWSTMFSERLVKWWWVGESD